MNSYQPIDVFLPVDVNTPVLMTITVACIVIATFSIILKIFTPKRRWSTVLVVLLIPLMLGVIGVSTWMTGQTKAAAAKTYHTQLLEVQTLFDVDIESLKTFGIYAQNLTPEEPAVAFSVKDGAASVVAENSYEEICNNGACSMEVSSYTFTYYDTPVETLSLPYITYDELITR